ncbi:FAD-binding and (Fe-S)-binding domain-containing protein [Arthrobacter tumbae]|uniref:FAD-binding and (Fe-S)-binding domain-containing protein n=1 Tax=Arthrobacter tumbae TaxID=163874 RepID=UPI00195D06D8|nr:FAD-binding and (Fe-S)-binding domain-containing protein [Arthrobacter tumbae]MBM7780954.1 FAD/FMN-containing dehydrogenase/Fe-S oxidoreductase [Arthrobacter tumbae]
MATTLTAPRSLVSELQSRGVADARADATSRAVYSSDASLYRIQPAAVVFPRHLDEVLTTLEVCRERGIPFTSRGAGTSLAGNAIGRGVVIDFSRHLNRVLEFDGESRTAVVEPGAVHATLQKVALASGLRFGPDPSTHTRCTVGGMIGNNACGSRALAYGRTADNVTHLDVMSGSGTRLRLGAGEAPASPETDALRSLVSANLGTIRTELGRFGRQVSGYSLEHLLPERGFDLRRMLVGSEGTLAVVLEAGIRLVTDAPHKTMVVLGFENIGEAGDAVTSVLPFKPTACEGLDSRIVEVVRTRKGPQAVPELPGGAAWLFVEISGDDAAEVAERAAAVSRVDAARYARIITSPAQAAALWRIREDGGGLAGRSPAGAPAHAGWEDAAVPPERLGDYLREFDELLLTHNLTGFPFGHFGDGCVHVRLDFPFQHDDGAAVFRAFLTDAARLVASYGGSLSGEHGDGRARSELLPFMYTPAALSLFGKVKGILDPDNILNPGVLVDPEPLDANVRVAEAGPLRTGLALGYEHDDGDFSQAVHRCTGVGQCRAAHRDNQTVMCPSYIATLEEKDSTRGRARALQEMINGSVVGGAAAGHQHGKPNWRAPEVHEALDLCLSCKGCASDCPTGVDMASYKAEVLHQSYKGRIRPASHYSLGWLPRWASLASVAPRVVNALTSLPGLGKLGLRLAGVDQRRRIPAFAPQTFHKWFESRAAASSGDQPQVLLWADSFTNNFSPEVGEAAVRVLEGAGYEVLIPEKPVCCGLTWISTGQLDSARKILRSSVETLKEYAEQGIPIVGLEPSCTGVLRSDSIELLGRAVAGPVAGATHTLAELLAKTPGYEAPSLEGTTVVAQPHCHHHAVMGWSPDAALLEGAGAELQKLGGCCGLAGNFGVERGHYEVSVAVAEQQLLPAVRAAAADAVVLADGYSCRTQLEDLSERKGIHLAQLLDSRLPAK